MTRHEAFINRNWREAGIANIVVGRIRRTDHVEIGLFLVDCWCLGVKDAAYFDDASGTELEGIVHERLPEEFREQIDPTYAKKLILGAVAYAERLGFAPYREYRKARRVFGGIDEKACTEEFTFGNEGKPCYAPGPSDSPEWIRRVLAILKARCGEDGFDYQQPEPTWDEGDEDPAEIARQNLIDFFECEPEDAPGFSEFAGMVAALHVCPEMITPTKLLEHFWGPDGRSWEEPGELSDFVHNFQIYWTEIGVWLALIVDDPPTEVWPIDHPDDEMEPEDRLGALYYWCRGFMRATTEWPGPWSEALNRMDLQPHWAIVRAWADLGVPENAQIVIEAGERESPEMRGQTLPLAIVALYRALRSENTER